MPDGVAVQDLNVSSGLVSGGLQKKNEFCYLPMLRPDIKYPPAYAKCLIVVKENFFSTAFGLKN